MKKNRMLIVIASINKGIVKYIKNKLIKIVIKKLKYLIMEKILKKIR